MKRFGIALGLVLFGATATHAQIIVHDPAVTARNAITATIKQLLTELQREQRRQLRRMARRLSLFTDLAKYTLPPAPRWRIHNFQDPDAVLFARDYHAALNYGDPGGAAYAAVAEPLVDTTGLVALQSGIAGMRDFLSRLATINVADAVAISATNDTGQLRLNGRKELGAISQLALDVLDPSLTQSTTSVTQKISGSSLLAARQRQARTEFLVGIVEQLLVDSKRARDTEATLMNMQLTTWRTGELANAAFVAGTGDALRAWRQP